MISRLPRATPVYVLGDSHAAIFADRLVLVTGAAPRTFVLRTLYAPGLRGSTVLDEHGGLAQPLRAALRFGHLLVNAGGNLEPYHRTSDKHWLGLAAAELRKRKDPALVLTVGGLDVYDAAVSWPYDDIAPPENMAPADAARWGEPDPVGTFEMAAWFRQRFAPLAGALAQLRTMGFERLALLSIVPPVTSDYAFRTITAAQGIRVRRTNRMGLRYKLVLHANQTLQAVAREAGVLYVDRWAAHTADGLVRPGLLGDNIHLGDAAADESAGAIVSAMFDAAPVLARNGAL